MKKAHKKVLSREFLYLLISSILFFSILYSWHWLYDINYEKQNNIENEIEKLTILDSLPDRLKLFYFLKEDFKDKHSKEFDSAETFLIKIKDNDYLTFWYNSLIEENLYKKSISDFFVRFKKQDNSEQHLSKIRELEVKLNKYEESFFNDYPKEDELLAFFIIVPFILRYLFYAVKWSINELRN